MADRMPARRRGCRGSWRMTQHENPVYRAGLSHGRCGGTRPPRWRGIGHTAPVRGPATSLRPGPRRGAPDGCRGTTRRSDPASPSRAVPVHARERPGRDIPRRLPAAGGSPDAPCLRGSSRNPMTGGHSSPAPGRPPLLHRRARRRQSASRAAPAPRSPPRRLSPIRPAIASTNEGTQRVRQDRAGDQRGLGDSPR